MQASAEDFGKCFSEVAVSHATRLANVNSVYTAARNLYYAIKAEIDAETTSLSSGTRDGISDWTEAGLLGNDVAPNGDGINTPVQEAGAALWDAMDAI